MLFLILDNRHIFHTTSTCNRCCVIIFWWSGYNGAGSHFLSSQNWVYVSWLQTNTVINCYFLNQDTPEEKNITKELSTIFNLLLQDNDEVCEKPIWGEGLLLPSHVFLQNNRIKCRMSFWSQAVKSEHSLSLSLSMNSIYSHPSMIHSSHSELRQSKLSTHWILIHTEENVTKRRFYCSETKLWFSFQTHFISYASDILLKFTCRKGKHERHSEM